MEKKKCEFLSIAFSFLELPLHILYEISQRIKFIFWGTRSALPSSHPTNIMANLTQFFCFLPVIRKHVLVLSTFFKLWLFILSCANYFSQDISKTKVQTLFKQFHKIKSWFVWSLYSLLCSSSLVLNAIEVWIRGQKKPQEHYNKISCGFLPVGFGQWCLNSSVLEILLGILGSLLFDLVFNLCYERIMRGLVSSCPADQAVPIVCSINLWHLE